mgnify:CR=1 FL=1
MKKKDINLIMAAVAVLVMLKTMLNRAFKEDEEYDEEEYDDEDEDYYEEDFEEEYDDEPYQVSDDEYEYFNDLLEDVELNDIGYLLALTGGAAVNKYAIEKFEPIFGEKGAFRIISTDEMKLGGLKPSKTLFTHKDDFLNLSEVVRDFPLVNEVEIKSTKHHKELMDEINNESQAIPMFLKDNKGVIHIISSLDKTFKVEEGNKLIYVGKTII